MNAAISPITDSLGNKAFFNHRGAIGKMQLEHMSSCFNIKADRKGIAILLGELIGQYIDVLRIQGKTLAQFDAPGKSNGKLS